MKTDKITVTNLFEKQRRYVVPIFQRGYVWTLGGQLRPLWRDIIDQARFLRAAKKLPDDARQRPVRKHFLGAVVFNEQNPGVRHVPISEVIDGQQRITTLQILLFSLRDVILPLEDSLLNARLRRWTENEGPYPDEIERYKVWPTNAFQDEIKNISSAGSASALRTLYPLQFVRRKPLPRPLLVQGYLFFCTAIQHYLAEESLYEGSPDDIDDFLNDLIASTAGGQAAPKIEKELSVERAELLLETVTDHFQLVEIRLEAEDDPQVIFETLNARGVALQPSDLIRNFVFLYASRHNEDAVKLYDAHWKVFDEAPATYAKSETGRFWKDKERQGRLTNRSRLDLFMFHYLTMLTGSDLKIDHVFPEFRDWWFATEEPRQTAAALADLQASASIYRGLIGPSFKTRLDIFAYRLKVLDTTTLYPLVLFIAHKWDAIGNDQCEEMLVDLESYLVRRAVCRKTPKNYNRIFLQLLIRLKGASARDMRESLRDEMLGFEGESAAWPDDEIFRAAFINDPMYEMLRVARTRMVLEGLELATHTARQEFVPLANPLVSPLTIEHIMPQTPKPENWPPIAPLSDGSPDIQSQYRRRTLLHSIGNLTLLTQPLNSEVSNGPFRVKRGQIALQSRLSLNSYFQGMSDNDVWNENAILARAEDQFLIARTVWPHP
jgi:hypothetical protein